MEHAPSWRMSELQRALEVISSSALVWWTRKRTCLSGRGRAGAGDGSSGLSVCWTHWFPLQRAKPLSSELCPVLSGQGPCGHPPLWTRAVQWWSVARPFALTTRLTTLCLSFFICNMGVLSGWNPSRIVRRTDWVNAGTTVPGPGQGLSNVR